MPVAKSNILSAASFEPLETPTPSWEVEENKRTQQAETTRCCFELVRVGDLADVAVAVDIFDLADQIAEGF